MSYYKCPRCKHKNHYIATEYRQNISGWGGGGRGGGGGFTPAPTPIFSEEGGLRYYDHHTPVADDPIQIDPININTKFIEVFIKKCIKCQEILSEKDKQFTKEEIEAKIESERKKEEAERKKEEAERKKEEAERKKEEAERKKEEAERKRKEVEEKRKGYENETDVYNSFAYVLFACLSSSLFFCSSILQAINVSIDYETAYAFSAAGILIAGFFIVLSVESLYGNIYASDRTAESILLAENFNYKLWLTAVILLFALSATIGWYYYDAFSSSQSLLYSLWCIIWMVIHLGVTLTSISLIVWGIMKFGNFWDEKPKRKYFRSTCPFCKSDFRAAYKYPNQPYTCGCGNRMKLKPS